MNTKKKPNRVVERMPDSKIEHIYNSALRITNYVGLNAGLHVLNQGLSSWPDIRDIKINKLREEMS